MSSSWRETCVVNVNNNLQGSVGSLTSFLALLIVGLTQSATFTTFDSVISSFCVCMMGSWRYDTWYQKLCCGMIYMVYCCESTFGSTSAGRRSQSPVALTKAKSTSEVIHSTHVHSMQSAQSTHSTHSAHADSPEPQAGMKTQITKLELVSNVSSFDNDNAGRTQPAPQEP